jgi:hypothetical protein
MRADQTRLNKAFPGYLYKAFSDYLHRMNSTNAAFLRQYYSILKMERQLHQLCRQYLQYLHAGQEQALSSEEEEDLFVKLLHDNTNNEGTITPVKITELPSPRQLVFLPQLLRQEILLSYDGSVYHSTESLYQDIVNLANKIGVSWCNIPTTISMPKAASPPPSHSFSKASNAGKTTTSITEDPYSSLEDNLDFYIPCSVRRAQLWLYTLKRFCTTRQALARSLIATPASTDNYKPHGSRSHNDTNPNLPTGNIIGKVSNFVRSVFNTKSTNTESAETTTTPDPKRSEITINADYPLLPLTEEEKTMGNHPLLGPSALLYQSLLTAYGRVYTTQPRRFLSFKMEQILAHMELVSSSSTFAPKPDHNMFVILMRHYGQIQDPSRAVAEKSDALLQRIVTSSSFSDGVVTTDTIMLVMRAYSRVKHSLPSALRCKALLKRLEEAESGGEPHLAPTTEAYNLCLRAFLKVAPTSMADKDAVVSYTEQILSCMVDRHKRGMQNGIPNTMTYNLAIAIVSAASSHSAEHLGKAHGWILYLQREYRRQHHGKVEIEEESSNSTKTDTLMGPPSTFAYNAYLQAALSHVKMMQLDDNVKKNKIIETVERLYNEMVCHGVSKPDYTTFEILFQMYRCSKGLVDAGERAEALLSRMEVQYATGRNNIVKPDARMYYYAITCWSSAAAETTSKVNAAARAYMILKTMDLQASIGNDELKPTEQAVSAVIHACSCTTHLDYQPAALRIAFECYNNMILQGIKPSAITYSCLLNCCATLVHDPIKRDKLARQVFAAACVRSL